MLETSRLGLPYPEGDESADGPAAFEALATSLDNAAITDQGPLSSRPVSTPESPGITGRRYYATDTGIEYLDIGVAWVTIGLTPHKASHQPGAADAIDYSLVNLRGLLADRPAAAAANAGLTYFATNLNGGTLYESTGTTWVQIAAGVVPAGVPFAGSNHVTGEQTIVSTTFALPATPDRVSGIALAANSIMYVAYFGQIKSSTGSGTSTILPAIFVNGVELQKPGSAGPGFEGAGVQGESYSANFWGWLYTYLENYPLRYHIPSASATSPPPTGGFFPDMRVTPIYVATAGTYQIDIRYRQTVSGTITIRDRHLWVWAAA